MDKGGASPFHCAWDKRKDTVHYSEKTRGKTCHPGHHAPSPNPQNMGVMHLKAQASYSAHGTQSDPCKTAPRELVERNSTDPPPRVAWTRALLGHKSATVTLQNRSGTPTGLQVSRGGAPTHIAAWRIGVTQVCTMGWCRYAQITRATSCGTAVRHEDSSAAGARSSLPAYDHLGGNQFSFGGVQGTHSAILDCPLGARVWGKAGLDREGATMGQVCFITAISSNRACPTVFIALSSVFQIIVLCACCPGVQWLGLRANVPSSLRHCTRSAVACWAVGWQTCSQAQEYRQGGGGGGQLLRGEGHDLPWALVARVAACPWMSRRLARASSTGGL